MEGETPVTQPKPKHVVFITTDHMRYDCIAAHGNAAMRTPNLDLLVNQGVSFDQCHVQSPLCMPSRGSFMTGLYPWQTGVTANGHRLPPEFTPTMPRLFAAAGYETAQIGKLHFEPHEDHDLDPRPRHDYGFDHFWIAEEAGCYEDAYMTWLRTEHPELVETFRVPRSTAPDRGAETRGRVLDAPWTASHSGWIAAQADRYLSRRAKPRQVFAHLGFFAPHPPLNPTADVFAPYADAQLPALRLAGEEWHDKPAPLAGMLQAHARQWAPEQLVEYRRHFYALVTGVDNAVGQVLDRLRHESVLEDTLIVFTSDHGDMCGDHQMVLKHHSFYDELTRVPCVLYWPRGLGTTPRRVGGLTELIDLMPTMLALCGQAVTAPLAGRNLAPDLLAGREPAGREDVLSMYHPDSTMLRSATHKYIRWNAQGTEVLYDLRSDPGELVNRAADPAAAAELQRMRDRMLTRVLAASQSPLRLANLF